MEMLFQQKSIGWCSVYMLANVFRNEALLEYLSHEAYKGCNEAEINHLLEACEPKLRLGNIVAAHQSYPALPMAYVWDIINKNDFSASEAPHVKIPILPYFLSVRLIESMWHHVAVLNIKGRLYYIDPYRKEVLRLKSVRQLSKLFIDCNSIDRPVLFEENRWAVLIGESLGYTTKML